MNGKRAKELRKMAQYDVTAPRNYISEPPKNGKPRTGATVVSDYQYKAYKMLKTFTSL